jgi:hypothetical protein
MTADVICELILHPLQSGQTVVGTDGLLKEETMKVVVVELYYLAGLGCREGNDAPEAGGDKRNSVYPETGTLHLMGYDGVGTDGTTADIHRVVDVSEEKDGTAVGKDLIVAFHFHIDTAAADLRLGDGPQLPDYQKQQKDIADDEQRLLMALGPSMTTNNPVFCNPACFHFTIVF